MTRIALIQGHPTSSGGHFCHALAEAYAEGAFAGGHQVRFMPNHEAGGALSPA